MVTKGVHLAGSDEIAWACDKLLSQYGADETKTVAKNDSASDGYVIGDDWVLIVVPLHELEADPDLAAVSDYHIFIGVSYLEGGQDLWGYETLADARYDFELIG